jgi:ABC-type nitrate/sulfonate/bicarbonate transport system ATPase subunit
VDEAILLSDRVLVMSRRPGRIRADFDVPLPALEAPNILLQRISIA